MVGTRTVAGGLYRIALRVKKPQAEVNILSDISLQLYHEKNALFNSNSAPIDLGTDDSDSSSEETSSRIDEDQVDDFQGTSSSPRRLRDRSLIRKPAKLEDYVLIAQGLINEEVEPQSYSEAIHCNSQEHWKRAMKSEIESLKRNQTWSLEKLPAGRKAIQSKWVYKIKTNAEGHVDKFKARLVAKGYLQKEGIDFSETFSPVSRLATIRSMLSVAAKEKLHLSQFDVATAFLYGDLDEEIFMKQPVGYDDGTDKVYRL